MAWPNGILIDGVMKYEYNIRHINKHGGRLYWDFYFVSVHGYCYAFVRREWFCGSWFVLFTHVFDEKDRVKIGESSKGTRLLREIQGTRLRERI